MSHKPSLNLIKIPLYISAVLYFLVSIPLIILFAGLLGRPSHGDDSVVRVVVWCAMIFGVALCIGLGVFIIYFTGKLDQRKKWAWICSIIFGCMYIPSAFFFLGIPIVIGAFSSDVMKWFNENVNKLPGIL